MDEQQRLRDSLESERMAEDGLNFTGKTIDPISNVNMYQGLTAI